ncbi:MAG: MarR family transcriptional regulator [Bacteroidota bacterium]
MPDLISDVSSLDLALAYRIHRMARRLRVHLVRLLAEHAPEISPEQWFLLFRLHERDGRSQSELTDPVLDDRPNVSRQVAGLIRTGHIERQPDPADGRRFQLFLTDAGRERVEQVLPVIVETRRALFSSVPPDALQTFSDVLATLETELLSSEEPTA